MVFKLPLTPEEFKSIYSRVPRLCVDLIIKQGNNTLLILRQDNGWEGMWHLPGGTVYYQEKTEEAAKRIAKRETGLNIKIIKLLTYLEYPTEVKFRGYGHSISLALLCKSADIIKETETMKLFSRIPKNTIIEQKEFLKTI